MSGKSKSDGENEKKHPRKDRKKKERKGGSHVEKWKNKQKERGR